MKNINNKIFTTSLTKIRNNLTSLVKNKVEDTTSSYTWDMVAAKVWDEYWDGVYTSIKVTTIKTISR